VAQTYYLKIEKSYYIFVENAALLHVIAAGCASFAARQRVAIMECYVC